ncbi:MAG: M15 family metallopeptidase [Elusimicrobia bacterium]|nr:M15 family metallopeptidase [Elusimicrobiota bacterium]
MFNSLRPRRFFLILAWIACLPAACAFAPRASREPLVDIREISKDIVVDFPYATDRNFTHRTLYPVNRCLLRASVAKRLALVQSDLAPQGLGLKLWDCYRPLSIQKKLWELVPNPDYVADPKRGSRHNRGAAVDVTLVDSGSRPLEMPTDFDDFSPKAHRDYPQLDTKVLDNRRRLEHAMRRRGFSGLKTEWWHFDAVGWERYPLLDIPLNDALEAAP